jgi:hypothetical protein
MPAPGRPHTSDHETLVIEREPGANKGEAVVEEPVVVSEYEPVVEEPMMVSEYEPVVEEGAVVDGEVAVHESLMVHHAQMATVHGHSHVTTVRAHSALHRQRARRRGGAQSCNCGQGDDELADNCVPPSGLRFKHGMSVTQACSVAPEPEVNARLLENRVRKDDTEFRKMTSGR